MATTKGGSIIWDDELDRELFPLDIIAETDLIADVCSEIVKARNEKKISQRRLAEISGLKQSAIARLEKAGALPRLDTILKLLLPLGKTLAVVPLKKSLAEYAAKTKAAEDAKTAESPADAAPASHGSGAPYPPGYAPMQAKGNR